MASSTFIDLDQIDLSNVIYDTAAIEAVNPQRGDMRHLDAICYARVNLEKPTLFVGWKDTRHDEFWVPGHIPGRPLFPGVLMIEAAAQLAGFMLNQRSDIRGRFIGFLGADNAKFRGQVEPGKRLYLIGQEVKFRARRMVCDVQGIVDDKLVYEVRVTGVPI